MNFLPQINLVIPNNISVDNSSLSSRIISFKGPLGNLNLVLSKDDPLGLVSLEKVDNSIIFYNIEKNKEGEDATYRMCSIIKNIFRGLIIGHTVYLKIIGLGYKVEIIKNSLVFNLGQSHPKYLEIEEGVIVFCENYTDIIVYGLDKEQVTRVAAKIRSLKPIEIYKGKGIRYLSEIVVLKKGKRK